MIKGSYDYITEALLFGRLTSLQNLEHHQQLIICSLNNYQHFLRISLKSVHKTLTYSANRDKHTLALT